jgi:parallel beta-helix repeat protein
MARIGHRAFWSKEAGRLRLLRIVIIASIVGILLTASLMSLSNYPASENNPTPVHAIISYTSHGGISINGNVQFNNTNYPLNGVVSGNGMASNPYIIGGWDIDANISGGVTILNANAHFIVRDCYIRGGGMLWVGIDLENCRNGTVSNNTCVYNPAGINLQASNGITLVNNTCLNATFYGIALAGSSNKYNFITQNRIINCSSYGVDISAGSDNVIWNNTFIGNNGADSVYDSNHIQASDNGPRNRWNSSGIPHGYGNDWSDWRAPDINWDDIVDYPYVIAGSADAKDYYPLAPPHPSDNMAPVTTATLSGIQGANGWYVGDSVFVNLTANDGTSGVSSTSYRIDCGSWLPYSDDFIITKDGTTTIDYFSTDFAGNPETPKSFSFKHDATGPLTGFSASAWSGDPTTWFTASVRVNMTPFDDVSGVNWTKYRINNGSWAIYTTDFYINENGISYLEYASMDNAGNMEPTNQFSVKIDRNPPTLAITTLDNAIFNSSSVNISWTCVDEVSGLNNTKYELDGGSATLCTGGVVRLTGLSDGTHVLTIHALDNAGNVAEKTITFSVNTEIPSSNDSFSGLLTVSIIAAIVLAGAFVFMRMMKRKKDQTFKP